jgi:rifampicin phosphotransferase
MVITEKSTDLYARREAGGKGYNLYLLSRQGLPVPAWIVLGSCFFRKFRQATGLEARIAQLLGALSETTPPALEAISAAVLKAVMETPFPSELEQEIRSAYRTLGKSLIAVRSSAADEDSAQYSFAGQLSTFLFVRTEEETLQRLKECWASAYSERSLSYRLQNKLDLTRPIEVAVVFQEMVASRKSGVLFTCDPIRMDPTKLTVNALYGVGEGLVSGLLDGDTFLLEKTTGEKLSEVLARKKSRLLMNDEVTSDGAGGENLHEVPVEEPLRDIPSLDPAELRTLAELARKVESFYRFPQDIEWAERDGRFYLLQSRPVTTQVRNQDGILSIWDNSNIVESYGGITLPLSFSFAHNAYHSVYVQFCEILMIPQHEIRKMDYFLRNMLGLFHGRVYYNLLNWYKLTSILPGFKYNRSFMETMMGTNESLADAIADRIKPPGFQENTSSKILRFVSGLKFLYFHFTIQSMVDAFLRNFHDVYGHYRKIDYSRMPSDEIQRLYQEVEQRMLFEWKAPIVNDYLCMIHFGILKKLTSKWLAKLGDSLQNDLLCGEGNLESAEPTRELIRMAGLIQADPALRALLEATPSEDCMEVLESHAGFAEFRQRVHRYIDLYGFRCMNEMKLEEKDLYQDTSFLFVCLKNYMRTGQTDLHTYEIREKEIRAGAERKVRDNLSGLRKTIYRWSLRNARKAVKNRENTRFCRTRIYGVARAMFHGMGRDFAARGMIASSDDIFYLQIQEIFGAIDATLTIQNLLALVELRKREYTAYEAAEPAARFMTRGPVYWQNDHSPVETGDEAQTSEADLNLPPGAMKGVGCCPGIVEGIVKVVLSPKDNLELNREILVTLRTDPGWIPLYPSASALLVERGGLLSHSAIVAREMGLPTIVGLKGLTQRLKTGMRVRINGETGIVEMLDDLGGVSKGDAAPGKVTEVPKVHEEALT